MLIRILAIVFTILYQNTVYSKTTDFNKFNHRYLSNYFSALLSYNNQDNKNAIKFFNSSKYLLEKHDKFLKQYIFSLVENGEENNLIRNIGKGLPLFSNITGENSGVPSESNAEENFEDQIKSLLANVKPDNLTPREALDLIYKLCSIL